jgi:hypothetical protein
VIKPVRAGAGALATALMLTACATSARYQGRSSAAPCTRVEEVVREVALETTPFSGVTTSRDLAAAGRKLRALGPLITAARKAEVRTFSRLGSAARPVKAPPLPAPLARGMRRLDADANAFSAAFASYDRSRTGRQAIGQAAGKMMRDIQAVRATCSRMYR